ncbi:MAG: AmmeMemoRadiSam system radical SAM enzyme [Candidatus ainarchaeum sp.]|nr:AmmeMemoRadiSam system radical SAM enzyme [Candidatus ainarchaeum sp.]
MEGALYKQLEDGKIQCNACSRNCVISEGNAGFCGVRKNKKQKLDLIVYGKPCSACVDPVEKKPLFHFLPGSFAYSLGTYGCNFSCDFCQNYDISQAPKDHSERFERMLKNLEDFPPKKIVDYAMRENCRSIAYTYNEPTIFSEYAYDIGMIAKKEGLKNIYVTNGYQTKECWDYVSEFLDAANIDLKGDDTFYKKLCGNAREEPVKESIKYAKKLGMWVEVTTLLIKDENDDVDFLKKTAEFIYSIDPEMPWHITAFYPCYKMRNKQPTSLEMMIKARIIGEEVGLQNVYCGNVISKYENTNCPKCKKTVIERWGFNITKNNVVSGKCGYCGKRISGVFE